MTHDIGAQALMLAKARVAAEKLTKAQSGTLGQMDNAARLLKAFNDLDNAGVFRHIDERTEYPDPADLIAASEPPPFGADEMVKNS